MLAWSVEFKFSSKIGYTGVFGFLNRIFSPVKWQLVRDEKERLLHQRTVFRSWKAPQRNRIPSFLSDTRWVALYHRCLTRWADLSAVTARNVFALGCCELHSYWLKPLNFVAWTLSQIVLNFENPLKWENGLIMRPVQHP